MSKKHHVTTTVNGQETEFLCESRQSLLEVLREQLRLTGAKEGCNNGNCGACTVLMNGLPVNSCIVLAVEAEGAALETVEGLACQGHLHPLQQCFLEGAALQCGVCTPGFLVTAKALLDKKPNPSEHDIRLYDKTALVRNVQHNKAQYKDQNVDLTVRVSQVWVQQDGEWRLVAIQFSPMPQD